MFLENGHLPKGYDFRHISQIDSTNEEAKRLAGSAQLPVWILADRQTKGRGRLQRHWVSYQGNLMTSLAFVPEGATEHIGQLSFVAALTVYDTVAKFAGEESLALKWPNDVLYEGKKIAGILLETIGKTKTGQYKMALGIGINLITFPEHIDYPTTSLKEMTGHTIDVLKVHHYLAYAFEHWYKLYNANGFEIIREAWLARVYGFMKKIEVKMQNEVISGNFIGLDETGHMLLKETVSGIGVKIHKVMAGDVHIVEEK